MNVFIFALLLFPFSPSVPVHGTYDSRDEARLPSGDSNSFQPAFNSIPNDPMRFKRNSNGDFNFKADRVSMLARVLTGISLQNGLMNGSIPGDEVIAELLNIGSVKLADVESFDKAMVEKFLSNLTETGKMDNDALELENGISGIQKVEMLWSNTTGLDKLPDSTALNKLNMLKTLNMTAFKQDVDPALQYLKDLLSLPDDTATNGISFSSAQNVLLNSQSTLAPLEGIITSVTSLKTQAIPWKELMTISQNLEALGPFAEAIETSYSVSFRKILTDVTKQPFVKNVRRVEGIIFDSGSEFKVMKSISTSSVQVKQHSPGFVNGFHDLKYIPADAKNSWLLETLNTGLPIEKGLERLLLFNETALELDSNWLSITNQSLHRSVGTTIQLQVAAQKFEGFSGTVNQTFSRFEQCSSLHKTADGSLLKRVSSNSASLRVALQALNSVFEMLTDEELQNFKNLSKSITLSDPARFYEEVPKAISNSKSKKATIESMQNISPFLATIRDSETFNSLVGQIYAHRDVIIKFHQNTEFSGMMKYFNCLKTIKAEIQSFSDVANFIKTLRQSTGFDEVIVDVRNVSNAIANSVPAVTMIRSIPDQFKTNHTAEETEMQKLASLVNTTKTFGIAVTGVVAIQRALLKRQSFQGIVNGLQSLNNSIEALTDPTVKANVKAGWGDIDGSKKVIQDLMSELNTKTGEAVRARRATSDLTAFGKFFSSLANMTDMDLDADRKIEALDALVAADPASQTAVSAVRDSLNEVSNLDLQFSRYSTALASMPNELVAIKTFFDSLVPPVVNQNPGNNGQNNMDEASPNKLSAGGSDNLVLYIILGVFASLFLFILFSYVWIIVRNWRKYKRWEWCPFYKSLEQRKTEYEKKARSFREDMNKTKERVAISQKQLNDQEEKIKLLDKKRWEKENELLEQELNIKKLKAGKEFEKELRQLKIAKNEAKKELQDAIRARNELEIQFERETREELLERLTAKQKLEKTYRQVKHMERKLERKEIVIDQKENNVQQELKKLGEEREQVEKEKEEREQQDIDRANYQRLEKELGPSTVIADGKGRRFENGTVVLGPAKHEDVKAFLDANEYTVERHDETPAKGLIMIQEWFQKLLPKEFMKKEEIPRDLAANNAELTRQQLPKPYVPPKCFQKSAVTLNGAENEKAGFIHANHIEFPLYGRAIATQIPLWSDNKSLRTLDAFYRMLWQEGVEIIVLITHPDDLKRNDIKLPSHSIVGGCVETENFRMTTSESGDPDELNEKELRFENLAGGEKEIRILKQYTISNWANGGGPQSQATRDAVRRAHILTRCKSKPIAVVCLDGAQRAGSFLGIEYLRQMVIDNIKTAKIERFTAEMRTYRDGAIGSPEALYFTILMALQIMIDEGYIPELTRRMRTQWDYYTYFMDVEYDKQMRKLREEKKLTRKQSKLLSRKG